MRMIKSGSLMKVRSDRMHRMHFVCVALCHLPCQQAAAWGRSESSGMGMRRKPDQHLLPE